MISKELSLLFNDFIIALLYDYHYYLQCYYCMSFISPINPLTYPLFYLSTNFLSRSIFYTPHAFLYSVIILSFPSAFSLLPL